MSMLGANDNEQRSYLEIVADEHSLYLLEFLDSPKLEATIAQLKKKLNTTIVSNTSNSIVFDSLQTDLDNYFSGRNFVFETPSHLMGSNFQKSVWKELVRIPRGETLSYAQLATRLGKPTAFRAVAAANGANRLAIIVPCHRLIGTDGKLTGYAGGLTRKQWLIEHEKSRR